VAYHLTGRYAEAIAVSKQALLRNPNEYSYGQLAIIYVQQWAAQLSQDSQTMEQALAAAQRAVAANDSWPPAHLAFGYVYLYQQQYEQALTEMEKSVALNPKGAMSYATLAYVLSRMGRAEEAVRAAGQALGLKPLVIDAHLLPIGVVYALAGRTEDAVVLLKRYLAYYPNILGAHLTLAAVYSELGKEAEARAEAAEVLRINPKFSLEVHKERAPLKDPAMLERHITALRKAGLK
jgi:adenylate cyclase